MIQYPISFSAAVRANSDTTRPWEVSASGNSSTCSIPTEFGGTGGGLSPEDYFLLALSNCFVATFKVYAGASRIGFESVDVKSELVLEKDSKGQPTAKLCRIEVDVLGAQDASRTATILNKVGRSGILLNSVKTELEFAFKINGERVS